MAIRFMSAVAPIATNVFDDGICSEGPTSARASAAMLACHARHHRSSPSLRLLTAGDLDKVTEDIIFGFQHGTADLIAARPFHDSTHRRGP